MKCNKTLLITLFCLLTIQVSYIMCDSVCTQAVLVTELIQDIKDNKKLDCLRVPLPAPTDRVESDAERKARLEAAWDTDCAFEADYDWLKPLKENFGLRTGLVDKNGKPVDNDFDDQADMCEIFRALVAGGIVEGVKLDDLSPSAADGLDCPGEGEKGQSEVCAVSGGAPGQKYSWYILLDGISFTTSNQPKWEMDPSSRKKVDAKMS